MKSYLGLCVVLCLAIVAVADDDEGGQGGFGGQCNCPFRRRPVCDVHGEEHRNEQCAYCARATVACYKPCPCGEEEEEEEEECPQCANQPYTPVCGVDGETYDSRCHAQCNQVEVACYKQCPCYPGQGGSSCPQCDYAYQGPVCGDNGVTYPSRCAAETCADEVEVVCEKKCPCNQGTECGCQYEFPSDVCGEDGVTYINQCALECADVDLACPRACPCGFGTPVDD